MQSVLSMQCVICNLSRPVGALPLVVQWTKRTQGFLLSEGGPQLKLMFFLDPKKPYAKKMIQVARGVAKLHQEGEHNINVISVNKKEARPTPGTVHPTLDMVSQFL